MSSTPSCRTTMKPAPAKRRMQPGSVVRRQRKDGHGSDVLNRPPDRFAVPCGSPQHRLSRSSYHIGISFWRCERGYFKYDLTMSMTLSAATICCEDGLCFPL